MINEADELIEVLNSLGNRPGDGLQGFFAPQRPLVLARCLADWM